MILVDRGAGLPEVCLQSVSECLQGWWGCYFSAGDSLHGFVMSVLVRVVEDVKCGRLQRLSDLLDIWSQFQSIVLTVRLQALQRYL